MVTVRDLAESPIVSEVIIGEANLELAEKVAQWTHSKKVITRKVDITDRRSLAEAISDVDAIANAAPFHLNLHVTKAAIKARRHLTDLGGVYHMTLEQLKLDREAHQAGTTIVLGSGLAPGVADILAKHGAEKLERVDKVHMRYGEVNFEPVKYKWSFRTVLAEYTQGPIIYTKGKLKQLQPFSGKHTFTFPPPIGRRPCCYALYSGLATLPKTVGKGVKTIDCAMSYSEEDERRINVLDELGLTQRKPIRLGEVEISPREFLLRCAPPPDVNVKDAAGVTVEVVGEEGSSQKKYSYSLVHEYHEKYGVSALAYLTGMPMSIVAQMLGKGDIMKDGVLPPEQGINPKPFFNELAKRGVRIIETAESTSNVV